MKRSALILAAPPGAGGRLVAGWLGGLGVHTRLEAAAAAQLLNGASPSGSSDGERIKALWNDPRTGDLGAEPISIYRDGICRELGVWIHALQEIDATAMALLALRDPDLVAMSSLQAGAYPDFASAWLDWGRQMLEAEYFSRDLPRFVLDLNDLRTDMAASARALSQHLAIALPGGESIAAFDLPPDDPLQADADRAPDWVRFVYAHMPLIDSGTPLDIQIRRSEFDSLREAISIGIAALGEGRGNDAHLINDIHTALDGEVEEMMKAKAIYDQETARLEKALFIANQTLEQERARASAEKDAEIQRMTTERERERAANSAEKDTLNAELAALHKRLEQLDGELAMKTDEIAELSRLILDGQAAMLEEQAEAQISAQSAIDALLTRVGMDQRKGVVPNRLAFWRRGAAKRTAKVLVDFELLDPEAYLQANADVAERGLDPSLHYVLYGWAEGRATR